ncbi:hypothetical protein [Isoalcanivorax beigongshangi]|uniref:Uncharacterized protein n=1 Tax=Isoalcanivorax beigongshangi TaxID=3238810 RepID=A0ABV4AJZ0_9GAMM
MGELNEQATQLDSIMARAKDLNRKLVLAGRGAVVKAEAAGTDLYDRYAERGAELAGDTAEQTNKTLLAGRGLLDAARELAANAPAKRAALLERLVDAGREQRGEKADTDSDYVLAAFGAVATLRSETPKLFETLVSAGEQRA